MVGLPCLPMRLSRQITLLGITIKSEYIYKESNMKLFILVITMLVSTFAIADTYVNGYYKSNGTYVQPHYRSDPDSSVSNNWSTKGNVNPYTGKAGTGVEKYQPNSRIQNDQPNSGIETYSPRR